MDRSGYRFDTVYKQYRYKETETETQTEKKKETEKKEKKADRDKRLKTENTAFPKQRNSFGPYSEAQP